MSDHYDVFVARFTPGHSVDPVVGLGAAFGLPREAAERLVRALPRVVRRRVPAAEAERTLHALQRIGAVVELRPCPLAPQPVVAVQGHDLHGRSSHPPDGGRVTLPSALPPPPGPPEHGGPRGPEHGHPRGPGSTLHPPAPGSHAPGPQASVPPTADDGLLMRERWSARTQPLQPPPALRPARTSSVPPAQPQMADAPTHGSWQPRQAGHNTVPAALNIATPIPIGADGPERSDRQTPSASYPAAIPGLDSPPPSAAMEAGSGMPHVTRNWSEWVASMPPDPLPARPAAGLTLHAKPDADPLALPFDQPPPDGMRPATARLPDAAATALQTPSMRPPAERDRPSQGSRPRGGLPFAGNVALTLTMAGICLAVAGLAFMLAMVH